MPDLALARRSLAAFAQMIGWPMALFQVEALTLRQRTTAIVAPRQSGKSRSLALLAVHWAFANPGSQILIVSAGDEAAKRLLAEVRHIVTGSDFLRGSVVDERAALVELTNGSRIRSVPASERQIRGWTIDLLLVDEAALVSDDLILGAAIPTTAARPNARIVLASSASAASGAFFDHVMLGRQGSENIRTFTWSLTDCSWISPSVIEAARESMTPTRFEAEYEGKFASGADALFPRALLDRATADYEMPGLQGLGRNAGLAGVDWGMTSDRTTFVVVSRLQTPAGRFAVTCAHAWPSGYPVDGPGGIIGQIAETPGTFDQVSMEVNGIGYPLAQEARRRLEARRRHGLKIELVTTTQASKAATYGRIRMALEQGRLILPAAATELLRELLLLRVQITQGGGEKIEAGSGHDDLADGLYLACGPYNTQEGWRSRLGDAIAGDLPASNPEFEGDVVETGAGLLVPRQPTFLTAGGARFGPPAAVPSPFEHPGRSSRRQQRAVGPPISTAAVKRGEERQAAERRAQQAADQKPRWFEGKTGAEILSRIRVTKRRSK
jgi:Helicase